MAQEDKGASRKGAREVPALRNGRKPSKSERFAIRRRGMPGPSGSSKRPARKPSPKETRGGKGDGTRSKGSKAREPGIVRKGSRKARVLGPDGKKAGDLSLPAAFDTPLRMDLIRRAVRVARANRRQPYGPSPRAGMRHSVETWGKGRGTARVQRIKDGRDGAESPNNVGGRRAHPPRPGKVWARRMNVRERRLARNSALGATADPKLVRARGHRFGGSVEFPLVVSDELQGMERTKDVLSALESLGLYDDLVRADHGKHIRAGKGKTRGRKYRVPRSVLIVVSRKEGIQKAGANLTGVDIVETSRLSTEDLAPGGDPGRLTVFTKSAIESMGGW